MTALDATERPVETRRGSIALSIKRLTAPAHRRAESVVAEAAPFASRSAYLGYLARLYGFYAAIEPRLFELLTDVLPDAHERRKLHLIGEDLTVLGASEAVATAPRCPLVPRLDCTASAMGVAYVLEGKTLGSRFLLEEARRVLALDVGRGARFFAGYEGRTGAMWRAYRHELERFVARHGRRTKVLIGATSMFASFTRWIGAAPYDRRTPAPSEL